MDNYGRYIPELFCLLVSTTSCFKPTKPGEAVPPAKQKILDVIAANKNKLEMCEFSIQEHYMEPLDLIHKLNAHVRKVWGLNLKWFTWNDR